MSIFSIDSSIQSQIYKRPNFSLGKSTQSYPFNSLIKAYKRPNRILYKFQQTVFCDDKLFLDDDFEFHDTMEQKSNNPSTLFGYDYLINFEYNPTFNSR